MTNIRTLRDALKDEEESLLPDDSEDIDDEDDLLELEGDELYPYAVPPLPAPAVIYRSRYLRPPLRCLLLVIAYHY